MVQIRCSHTLAVIAASVAFTFSVQAAANRTFVSTGGNDSNTSLNCGATTPCRTFGAALSVTNSGGEIVVLTSGGYGPASITQPVTITAIGVTASVTATGGADGLTINTTGNVTINGLGFHGMGSGAYGIIVWNAGLLRLDNVTVEGFSFEGIWLPPSSASFAIYDSYISDNAVGLSFAGTGNGFVKNTIFDHNQDGFTQAWGDVVVEDSAVRSNSNAGFNALGGALSLIRVDVVQNGIGINATGGTTQFSYSNITQNTNYAIKVAGGTVAGSNPGTSVVSGSVSGSLAAAVSLQ